MTNHINSSRFAAEDLVPVSELQKAPGQLVRRVGKASRPLVITQRGRVAAFLVSPAQYAALVTESAGTEQGQSERRQALTRALEEMLPIIREKYRPEKIVLFGSLAEGRVTAFSDIDLLVVKRTTKRSLERRKELVHLVRPRVATDFFVYTPEEYERGQKEGRAFFVREVAAKGKVLYEKAV